MRNSTTAIRRHIGACCSLVATLLACSSLLLSGCANRPVHDYDDEAALRDGIPALNRTLFGARPDLPDSDELLTLTPAQKRHFRRFYESLNPKDVLSHKRIHQYLTRHLSDIEFSNRTLSVAETIESRHGNCMSLALVTTALARAVDVRVGWQLADTQPIYSSEGTVIYRADHIQVRLYKHSVPRKGISVIPDPGYLLIDYFTGDDPSPGRKIDEDQMMALVYQNLGVEAMVDGDHDRAFWLLDEALQRDPANANLLNALAVLHRRVGDDETAERLFLFALDTFGDRLIVLRNYQRLLLAQERDAEADRIEQRLLDLPDSDPYPVLALGDEALREGRTETALGYYRRARKLAPYLHEIHWKLARAHSEAGDSRKAEKELRKAREKALAVEDRQRYDSKLRALSAYR